jgi:hypothetical protein
MTSKDQPAGKIPPDSVATGDSPEQAGTETPPTKVARPPRPRVFGRYAFAICVVPFLIYYLGTSAVGYLDKSRAHTFVQYHRAIVADGAKRAVERASALAQDHETQLEIDHLDLDRFVDLVAVKEEIEMQNIETLYRRFVADDSPLTANDRAALTKEFQFMQELIEADHKHLYRDVLEKGHQRRMAEDAELSQVESAWQRWFPPDRTWYPTLYFFTVIATSVALMLVFPGLLKAPLKFSWWSVVVGVVGIVVWIGLWKLDRDFLRWFNRIESRAAFNPFDELKDNPDWMRIFIAIRVIGLVLVVPVVEEFFLRGWLMRYIDDPDWDEIPLGTAGKWAILGVFVYAGLSHPSEAIAALAWFGMVTWLYLKTGSIWNCVIAHAITNLLLAAYVLYTRSWVLW